MPIKATPLYEVFPGHELEGNAFRVTRGCPPVVSDFLSYEALGVRYDRRDFFKGTGVSMYTSARRAVAAGRRFKHGTAVATVDLDRDGIVWSPTGRRGHITVWGAPATLLEGVVQCETYD